MHDRDVIATEAANNAACWAAADKAGHLADVAEDCEGGELGCSGCPWKKEREDKNARTTQD